MTPENRTAYSLFQQAAGKLRFAQDAMRRASENLSQADQRNYVLLELSLAAQRVIETIVLLGPDSFEGFLRKIGYLQKGENK